MTRVRSSQLRVWGRKLFLIAGLAAATGAVVTSSTSWAQTEATQHPQNFDPNSQVQITGKPADSSKSFSERYSPPKDFTSFAHDIVWVFEYTSWVTFIFFVLMAAGLFGFIFMYRQRPGHKAYYTHGTEKKTTYTTKILDIAVFISLDLVLIFYSFKHTRDIVWAYPSGPDVVQVMVMPQQWAWNFKYPGLDGKFNTEDDIYTINDLRVPKGKKVMLEVKSKDVIHGFYIPNVRIQIDAIPGAVTKFWFDANENGDYEIACFHHCGTSHYKMKAFLKVMEPADWDLWMDENSKWAVAKYDPEDKVSRWGWNWGLEEKLPNQNTEAHNKESAR